MRSFSRTVAAVAAAAAITTAAAVPVNAADDDVISNAAVSPLRAPCAPAVPLVGPSGANASVTLCLTAGELVVSVANTGTAAATLPKVAVTVTDGLGSVVVRSREALTLAAGATENVVVPLGMLDARYAYSVSLRVRADWTSGNSRTVRAAGGVHLPMADLGLWLDGRPAVRDMETGFRYDPTVVLAAPTPFVSSRTVSVRTVPEKATR